MAVQQKSVKCIASKTSSLDLIGGDPNFVVSSPEMLKGQMPLLRDARTGICCCCDCITTDQDLLLQCLRIKFDCVVDDSFLTPGQLWIAQADKKKNPFGKLGGMTIGILKGHGSKLDGALDSQKGDLIICEQNWLILAADAGGGGRELLVLTPLLLPFLLPLLVVVVVAKLLLVMLHHHHNWTLRQTAP